MFELKQEIKDLFPQEVAVFSFPHQQSALSKDQDFFQDWLSKKANGDMNFLNNNLDARNNPNLILEGVQTALVFLFPYSYGENVRFRFPNKREHRVREEKEFANSLIGKKLISKYVYGKDYHKKIKIELENHALEMHKFFKNDFSYRIVVDSVPFFDRAHARESGLGFVGKNTMLIRPGMGSFFFIASILTNLPVSALAEKEKNPPNLDCGTCNKCVEACPTQALEPGFFLNAKRCLSYLTIEHRDIVEEEFLPHFKDTIYGCDICQNVCPYNLVTLNYPMLPAFAEHHSFFSFLSVEDVATMNQAQYAQWFGGTAATRAKYQGLVRNALYHLYAIGHPQIIGFCSQEQHKNDALIQKTCQQILKFLKFPAEQR
jgi:epoxyqueuosine reductase